MPGTNEGPSESENRPSKEHHAASLEFDAPKEALDVKPLMHVVEYRPVRPSQINWGCPCVDNRGLGPDFLGISSEKIHIYNYEPLFGLSDSFCDFAPGFLFAGKGFYRPLLILFQRSSSSHFSFLVYWIRSRRSNSGRWHL